MHRTSTLLTASRRRARCGRHPRLWRRALAAACAVGLLAGCSLDGLLNDDELPPDVTDPALSKTPDGALAAYHRTIAQFGIAYGGGSDIDLTARLAAVAAVSGVLTDELQSADIGRNAEDARDLPEGSSTTTMIFAEGVYSRLQRTRGQAGQAIGLVRGYGLASHQPLLGHLYALQGYATLFLGELFCSGVPLSTLDFEGDYTLQPGSTTREILERAVALFDTALATAGDSTRFADLARVGRARALLGLGEFAQAAAAAAAVPDGYAYRVGYTATSTAEWANFAYIAPGERWPFSVANREGTNGLDYVSSGDPRTRVTSRGTSPLGETIRHPDKYAVDGSSPIVLASGIEARLIEAEAALQHGGDWLGILNALRTTCTDAATCPTPAPAGSGGVAGLPPLTDPGTDAARVDLLFRERAFWLFLTGHRQGDLRRLIRQYGRTPQSVYPSGAYRAGGHYGTDVTLPVPKEEALQNPRFTGCISRNA